MECRDDSHDDSHRRRGTRCSSATVPNTWRPVMRNRHSPPKAARIRLFPLQTAAAPSSMSVRPHPSRRKARQIAHHSSTKRDPNPAGRVPFHRPCHTPPRSPAQAPRTPNPSSPARPARMPNCRTRPPVRCADQSPRVRHIRTADNVLVAFHCTSPGTGRSPETSLRNSASSTLRPDCPRRPTCGESPRAGWWHRQSHRHQPLGPASHGPSAGRPP